MSTIFNYIVKRVTSDIASSLIFEIIRLANSVTDSSIEVSEWDYDIYNKINYIVYKLDPNKYNKHKVPTTNKELYELELGTSYFIRRKECIIKVDAYKDKKDDLGGLYPDHKLKVTFFGNKRYLYRNKFLRRTLSIKDKNHIKVTYLMGDDNISNDLPVHSFDNIILDQDVKDNIINGLIGWKNSKQWYIDHQIVHKIGILLYGKSGTGKSTLVRCISSMFKNAPILTLNPDNIMASIKQIINTRKKCTDTLIVLIEDFDMFFKSRESLEGESENINVKKAMIFNQNALFQLLDGVYSTENTIYIATTNYIERVDSALIRYGRFDIQEELEYFDYNKALEAVELLGYDEGVLNSFDLEYPVQPSELQSRVLDYRSSENNKKIINVDSVVCILGEVNKNKRIINSDDGEWTDDKRLECFFDCLEKTLIGRRKNEL